MTLADFLRARLDEDELRATEAGGVSWASWNRSWDSEPVRDIAGAGVRLFAVPMTHDEHVARWSPARVLAEVEAKRRIVEFGEAAPVLGGVLRLLALPYADHPDYREEWRP